MKFAHACFAFAALVTTGCVSQQEPVAAPGCPAHQPQQEEPSQVDPSYFAGTWKGQGCKSNGPCWTVRVNIEADEEGRPQGTVAYPSDGCAARLEFVQWEPGDVAAFRERFDNPGKCVPDGWLRLRLVDANKLSFIWSWPDGRVDAGTTLTRAR